MEAIDSMVDSLREFAKDSIRLVKRCHKPDHKGESLYPTSIETEREMAHETLDMGLGTDQHVLRIYSQFGKLRVEEKCSLEDGLN